MHKKHALLLLLSIFVPVTSILLVTALSPGSPGRNIIYAEDGTSSISLPLLKRSDVQPTATSGGHSTIPGVPTGTPTITSTITPTIDDTASISNVY